MGIQSRKSTGNILKRVFGKIYHYSSDAFLKRKRPPQMSRMLICGVSFSTAIFMLLGGVTVQLQDTHAAGQSPIPKMKLYREFKKAQVDEFNAMEKQLATERKELRDSQAQRKKEWEEEAKLERHQYFKDNIEPKKRKEYIQDFMKKREAFKRAFADEVKEQKLDHANRKKALQADQKYKHQEFHSALERGEEPSPDLWPEQSREAFLKALEQAADQKKIEPSPQKKPSPIPSHSP